MSTSGWLDHQLTFAPPQLNDELGGIFQRWYPAFVKPVESSVQPTEAAAEPPLLLSTLQPVVQLCYGESHRARRPSYAG
jgi:hypothetical protein